MKTTLPPRTTPHSQGVFGIDPMLGAVSTKASVASGEDSYSQAILKLLCLSSLDYRVHLRLPLSENPINAVSIVRNLNKIMFFDTICHLMVNLCIKLNYFFFFL